MPGWKNNQSSFFVLFCESLECAGIVDALRIQVSVLHLGGVYKRMEYIAVGEPLLEAFTAEHHAKPGDVSDHRPYGG